MLVFCFPAQFIKASSAVPTLRVVQSGTTNVTQLPILQIGSTFSADVRVDNTGSNIQGVNSVSFTLTWNSTILKCINAADGNYLPSQSNANDIPPDNTIGTVTFGLITHDVNNPLACAANGSSGVVATVTFQVLSLGSTNLAIVLTNPNIAYLTYLDGNGVSHEVTNTQIVDASYNQLFTSINVYQLGTNNSTIQFPPGSDPVGSFFTVEVNMSNLIAEPIWAWNIGINWDPTVLQLITLAQGDYLTDIGGLYDGSPTVFVAGLIDNPASSFPIDNLRGSIPQGISDIYLSNVTTTKASGSLCLLTFEVASYGNSYINITAGDPTLMDNFGNSQPVILNNAQYISVPPPQPRAPIAVIRNQAASTSYLPGATITLDAYSSLPGFDIIPNPIEPNIPITQYTWGVSGPLGFTIPHSGSSITFITPNPASPFLITLTISTASNPSDPKYYNTNSSTMEFDPAYQQLTSAGAQIDLYIVNTNPTNTTTPIKFPTSQGIYNTNSTVSYVDTFAPDELMNLQTFLINNGAPVSNELVTFLVTPQNDPAAVLSTFVSYTNSYGYAFASYRLPKYNVANMPFGNYTVTAFVDIAQIRVSDCFTFQYNYILTIFSITHPAQTARGQQTSFSVTIQCNSFIPQNYFMSWTVTDNYNIPIISSETFGIAFPNGGSNQQITLTIPKYSYYGTATLHVNLFNGDPTVPSQNALPYCPESDQYFTINP